MPLNFSLAGKAYPEVMVTVTAEQIEAYARASDDSNPRYLTGPDRVAPPVFPVVAAFPLMVQAAADPELGVENPLKILHGEQEFRYHRPLRAGQTLLLRPTLERVEDKGSGATFVLKVAASAEGVPVVDQWWTIFVRGAGSGRRVPSERKPIEPPSSEEVAVFTQKVGEDMPAQYAEASGDHNPIHLDAEVARAVGLPGVINHGLGTLALVSGGLIEQVADGDPERLRRLYARFTLPVFPGQEVTTTVWRSPAVGFGYQVIRPDARKVIAGELEVA